MDPILQSFRRHCSHAPDAALALAPGRRVCRAELAEQAERLARELPRAPQGTLVGLVAGPGPVFLAAWLALRARGLCPVLIDATTPAPERRGLAERLGAAAIWRFDDPWPAGEWRGVLEQGAAAARALAGVATVKLTSGSSGAPSGVAVPARALVADYRQIAATLGLTPEDRFLATLPLSHSYGFSVLASPAWLDGAALVFPDGHDPLAAATACAATVFPSVPSWFRAHLGLGAASPWPASMRLLVSAGAPLDPDSARGYRERFGLAVQVLYGSSECGSIAFDRRGDAAERGSVGTPLEGVEVELEPCAGAPAGAGSVSVRSAAVAAGYVPADAPGAERLAGGRFRTLDLARREGEELFLCGRLSGWINVKGKKVDPREVEAVLCRLAGVREAVVLGQPLPRGEGELVRAIVACPGGDLRWRDVVVWCRAHLAAHKVPRSVVVVPEIPRNERGKLDRDLLLELR